MNYKAAAYNALQANEIINNYPVSQKQHADLVKEATASTATVQAD